jgi:hypothetical protein
MYDAEPDTEPAPAMGLAADEASRQARGFDPPGFTEPSIFNSFPGMSEPSTMEVQATLRAPWTPPALTTGHTPSNPPSPWDNSPRSHTSESDTFPSDEGRLPTEKTPSEIFPSAGRRWELQDPVEVLLLDHFVHELSGFVGGIRTPIGTMSVEQLF